MKFTVNGTEYEGAKYDFNTHCEFDAMGVSVLDAQNKPLPVLRAYLAISTGMNIAMAGKEIEKHLIDGGSLNDMMLCLTTEVTNSDFFIALMKRQEEKPKRSKTTKANVENTET